MKSLVVHGGRVGLDEKYDFFKIGGFGICDLKYLFVDAFYHRIFLSLQHCVGAVIFSNLFIQIVFDDLQKIIQFLVTENLLNLIEKNT